VLMNSDVIVDVDGADVLAFHVRHGGLGTMTLSEVDDTRPYGVAALGEGDRIQGFVEKPAPENAPSHWINAGLQIWAASVLAQIPAGRPVSWETEIVPGLLREKVYGYRLRGFWEDAGTPERLLHSQRLLFDGHRGGPGTLPVGARGTGPVAVLPNVRAKDATFGPYVHLGEGVTIGPGAHVENSILMDGVTVGAGASVTGSILGPRVTVRPEASVRGQVLGEGAQG
jgi:mannose-1-phosphate guanylyltransferase